MQEQEKQAVKSNEKPETSFIQLIMCLCQKYVSMLLL